jgi:hypothetical protein
VHRFVPGTTRFPGFSMNARQPLDQAVFWPLGTIATALVAGWSPGPTPGACDVRYSYWTVGRTWWQIPAAIVVAVVGAAVAVVLAKRSAPKN